jgi:hypothetical protein
VVNEPPRRCPTYDGQSPSKTTTCEGSIRSVSAATCGANDVRKPWPIDCVPHTKRTLPTPSTDDNVDFLGQQAASGRLDIVGDGVSQKYSPARRVGFARIESGPVDRFHRFAEQDFEGTGFIGRVRRIGVWHLLRPDKVAALEIDRIEAQLERGLVHQTLDQEAHFRAACAAVGIDRRGIGERRRHFGIDHRRGVLPREQRRVQNRRNARGERQQVRATLASGRCAWR